MKIEELKRLIEGAHQEDLAQARAHNELTTDPMGGGLSVQFHDQDCDEDKELILWLWNKRRSILAHLESKAELVEAVKAVASNRGPRAHGRGCRCDGKDRLEEMTCREIDDALNKALERERELEESK